jgi:hypothetical protein
MPRNMEDKAWHFPQEVLRAAKIEDLKFLLSEAKERLKVTSAIADNLTNRSMLLFSLATTAIITMMGYAGLHFAFNPAIVSLLAACILLWVGCTTLKPNIVPQEYYSEGADPNSIAVSGMFTDLDGERTPEWYMIANLIEAYDERIKINRSVNETKAQRIETFINYLYAIPPMAVCVYLIFGIFGAFLC